MAVACASRFSVLKLEDDEITESVNKKPSIQNNKQAGKNKGNKESGKVAANESKTKSKKKKKTAAEIAELQSLAFGNHNIKPKHKSSSASVKASNCTEKQWEEWKLKDSEFVSEAYEQDLQEALLLSKIDYEEKKDVYDALQRETEQNKFNQKKKKKNNQKKEKGTMSLDEFQNMDTAQIESGNFQKSIADLDDFELPAKPLPDESDFFHKIEEDAEKIITKEQRQEHFKAIDPQIESARLLQYQEDLRKKDEEIAQLNEYVKKLKEELKNVKARNKKLYGILETGEMREKAEILVQIEQLISVKDELTVQVKEYHTALEQERSKVHSLQTELKKCQNSKKRTESK